AGLGETIAARRITPAEVVELAVAPPAALALGDGARALCSLVELAQRSVSEGLVHPQLTQSGGRWFALWGAVLDERVQGSLERIAAALPSAAVAAFGGGRLSLVA